MPTITTGRTLDQNGHPINGTGFDYDSDDRLAQLLNQRISPLFSQPITGEWIFALILSKDTQGQPKFLQAMVIGSEYANDTVFTNPPPSIAIPVAKALAPLGRMRGYRPTYAKYAEEIWWSAHVEQPLRNEASNS